MSSPIPGLTRDPCSIIFGFLGPIEWAKASKVCKTWNAFIKNTPWINEQLSYWNRLPKILQQNLPNRKLPILHVGGEIVPSIVEGDCSIPFVNQFLDELNQKSQFLQR